ncbi:MAG: hypothetical protein VZR33_04460 [Methanosphaera sp.]|nr:hypothetical protein [Methanosphaera sp.]
MSAGVYGISVPANIDSSLVDIYYAYHKTRNSDNSRNAVFTKLPSSILANALYDGGDSTDNVLEGMYNLKLPLEYFNQKGFYTIYIKPKEIPAVIADISTLAAHSNINGIVLDSSSIEDSLIRAKVLTNNSLVGWRIIYIDDNGDRQDYYRLITSNNKCEPIVMASNSSSDKSYTYRYNENSTLSFLTVTPSSAPSFKANAAPYIGKPTQRILLVNTMFEPVMIDLELVEHDADTISTMLEGSQLRSLDNGLITTFNSDNEIYNQSENFTLKDSETGQPIYEVKQNRTNNVDYSQTLDDKI